MIPRTCGRCGRTVWLHEEGDQWVGKCEYCGQYRVEDSEEEKPEPPQDLLGLIVEWEDDNDEDRISHGEQFFEDPDDAEKYAQEQRAKYRKTWTWPVYN